jgi:aspartyl/asparaginyl beta-hydroxylase (cupin superfamily)
LNFSTILEEYKSILEMNNNETKSDYVLSKDEHKLNNGEWSWDSFILKGKKQQNFSTKYPKTAKILESFLLEKPKLMSETPFSYAFFSTLKKESKISPHYGPCNLRVRCHFPLIIPKGDCGMEVGGKVIKWEEGVPLFFDDCYEHSGKYIRPFLLCMFYFEICTFLYFLFRDFYIIIEDHTILIRYCKSAYRYYYVF